MSSEFEKIKRELLNKYDLGGDGKITEDDLRTIERIAEIESKNAKERDRDKREDAQRRMAWFSLFGMLLYPVAVVISSWLGLSEGSNILGSMASIYFVSVAAIVAAFFGTQAYASTKNQDHDQDIH
jgi:hypothetical protein